MCMQCVRADRREAEGRPARWQGQQARVLFVDFRLDASKFERAFREFGLAAQRSGIHMAELERNLAATSLAAPTPAHLESATDVSTYFRDARFGRGA